MSGAAEPFPELGEVGIDDLPAHPQHDALVRDLTVGTEQPASDCPHLTALRVLQQGSDPSWRDRSSDAVEEEEVIQPRFLGGAVEDATAIGSARPDDDLVTGRPKTLEHARFCVA